MHIDPLRKKQHRIEILAKIEKLCRGDFLKYNRGPSNQRYFRKVPSAIQIFRSDLRGQRRARWDMPSFKTKRRKSIDKSLTLANARLRGKREASADDAAPSSPDAITGALPQAATRGRRKGAVDVTPRTKAKIALEYAEAGGKAGGAGRKVAKKYDMEKGQPAKFYEQVKDRDTYPKREGNCGRPGLLERRPEIEDLIRDALIDDDEQSYEDLAAALSEPKTTVWRACHYYPRPVRGKGSKRADPGSQDPTVEWSPISWLQGREGFAKWL